MSVINGLVHASGLFVVGGGFGETRRGRVSDFMCVRTVVTCEMGITEFLLTHREKLRTRVQSRWSFCWWGNALRACGFGSPLRKRHGVAFLGRGLDVCSHSGNVREVHHRISANPPRKPTHSRAKQMVFLLSAVDSEKLAGGEFRTCAVFAL